MPLLPERRTYRHSELPEQPHLGEAALRRRHLPRILSGP